MENGASLLKKLGIIFLCIGTLGVSGSLILCFIVPSLWLFSIIFGSVLALSQVTMEDRVWRHGGG